jgi:4-hydroxybenzoate polyprenyltransferase
MKLITAFFKLVRWPNLLFIALTQFLFYYCIYLPVYHQAPDLPRLLWLILASVCIAAAGYIINDYFDLNIDQINKPEKNVVDRVIHRRSAILWHFLLSFLGIIATVVAVGLSKWYLILANVIVVALLWFYSTSFKRQLLIGNFVISLLTSWSVLIIFFAFTETSNAFRTHDEHAVKLFRSAFLYAGFAFVMSLIREAIKDMEDMEGDARYGCTTLPIYAGLRTARIYTAVWLVVIISALIVLQLYVLQFGWWEIVCYSTFLVILPLIYILYKIFRATNKKQFSVLSALLKFVMFTGILSMIFFRFYF